MKRIKHRVVGKAGATRRDGDVRREIENFLRALSSYPERFARDPYLSFEQHLFSIAAGEHLSSAARNRN